MSDRAREWVAVLLAAGASSRMGESKAALRWRGDSFLGHGLRLARHAVGSEAPVLVVEGAHPLDGLVDARLGAQRVTNLDWRRGPLSSLQCALARPEATGRACLVLSVDRPHLRESTLDALRDAFHADPRRIWQPATGERRGHPIIWPADLCVALRKLQATSSPRELLRKPEIAARRAGVPVDDPAIFDNIDDPDALARLRALTP